ncbi:hypothetical protein FHS59_002739 [Algoriphagus iocasae]|uniref:Uncharacterized protein n=1 Tax=Algoriphagus iocasae TaxID=1836499 RepID=A0A841MYP5_9BACT|nr:hypothetical protein [Algoriphagus iocasae]MBB6327111.1 hypothetical protein [Algoriphagus iocasae]
MDKKGKSPTRVVQGSNECSSSFQNIRYTKDTYFLAQEKRVFRAFWGPPRTMLEVEAITGIMRSNICYFVGDWLKTNSIKLVGEGICSVSKHKAGRYSTDPKYWKGGEDES